MRLAIGLVLLAALAVPAAAQTATGALSIEPAAPAPRVTLDVALPPPPAHRLSGFGPPGRLAAGPDGSLYVLTSSFQPSPYGILPARSARIEVLAYGPDGRQKYRTTLPVQAGVGPNGFNAESLGIVAYPSGRAAVFLSSSNQGTALPQNERAVTSIFRLDGGGAVESVTTVSPPTEVAGGYFLTKFYLPTADEGLLVAGGFGPNPFNWWIGKYDAKGRLDWQAGPGPAYPEDVYGLALLPDGSVSAIIQEVTQVMSQSRWYVARFGPGGAPLGRASFPTLGTSFARLPGYWVSAVSAFQTAGNPALVRLGDQGRELGRVPWPYDQTRRMIADGRGITAIACAAAGPLCFVVHASTEGKQLWRSPAVSASDIVRTADGQVAAVVWSGDGLSARLVRYAAP
ncbi:hypothetical protein [Reyranella sp.]|uniref:hypothetical protein n=1 Tax=Reyranella sp. TaxID=1929291 RepID=UPI003BA9A8DA